MIKSISFWSASNSYGMIVVQLIMLQWFSRLQLIYGFASMLLLFFGWRYAIPVVFIIPTFNVLAIACTVFISRGIDSKGSLSTNNFYA